MKKGKNFYKKIVAIVLAVLLSVSGILTYVSKSWRSIIASTDSNLPAVSSVVNGDAQNKPLCVNYIDVGQGDCTLIRFGGYNILIDCAKSKYENTVLDFLNSLGITYIDLAIETHPDSDHIGGFKYILSNIKCGLFLMPQMPTSFEKTDTEYTLISTLKTLKIKTEYAVNNKTYEFGDMRLTTYLSLTNHDDKNDYSVISKVTYKNSSFLFMGDASKEVEDELIARGVNLSADVLKAGHHGSNKSTSENFIKNVKPSVVVFSCGLNNEYGHPAKAVLQTVSKYNIKILRTDTLGCISIGTDGEKYYLVSEKG